MVLKDYKAINELNTICKKMGEVSRQIAPLTVSIAELASDNEELKTDLAKCRAFIKHLEEECNCTDDYSDALYEWKKAEEKEG